MIDSGASSMLKYPNPPLVESEGCVEMTSVTPVPPMFGGIDAECSIDGRDDELLKGLDKSRRDGILSHEGTLTPQPLPVPTLSRVGEAESSTEEVGDVEGG